MQLAKKDIEEMIENLERFTMDSDFEIVRAESQRDKKIKDANEAFEKVKLNYMDSIFRLEQYRKLLQLIENKQ